MAFSKCKKDPICQSCTMPLKNKADFGTNTDGSTCLDYCKYCYIDGNFTEPNLTKDEMLKKAEDFLKKMSKEEKIEEIKSLISKLKRWK